MFLWFHIQTETHIKKILILSVHFYTTVLLLIIVFMVKMHFFKHVFNVFQKNQVLLAVSHIIIH